MDRKIILFELNEVPMTIVHRYVDWRPDSTLARTLPRFRRYITQAEDQSPLSPWTTWPSLHRGVVDSRHGVLEFGQDLQEVDREFPPVWRILADSGVSTGVCGSLHSYPLPEQMEGYAFYLPDTFAAGSECFPRVLSSFQEFNLAVARTSARNVSTAVPWGSALRMLRAAPELGLRLGTITDIGKQLATERLRQWRRIRRRTYQAVLAFDIYYEQLKRTEPGFSTFFTNHVASSMHRYWAATFPDDYETNGFDARWIRRFRNEIEFTMSRFDEFLTRLVGFVEARDEYQVWIATSMGQEATTAEPVATQVYARDLNKLMEALGMPPGAWEERPAMAPQVNVRVADDHLETLRTALDRLTIDGQPVAYRVAPGRLVSIAFGHVNLEPDRQRALLGGDTVGFADLGLENVTIEDQSGTSAYHVPEGCMLIYDPRDLSLKNEGPRISTLDVAPSLLRNFSVQRPAYMNRGVELA